jgi:hypothetical protein
MNLKNDTQPVLIEGQGARLMCLFFDENGSWQMIPETVISWRLDGDQPTPITARSVWRRANAVGLSEGEFIVGLEDGEYYRNHHDWVEAILPVLLSADANE